MEKIVGNIYKDGGKLYVGEIHVPQKIVKIIVNHIRPQKNLLNSPYMYTLSGTNARGGFALAAEGYCGQIAKWAMKNHATVHRISNFTGGWNGHMVLKITDPVSFVIESLLKYRHKLM